MRVKRLFAPVALCLAVAGCASVYQFDLPRDDANIPTVKTIVQEVTCELAALARDDYQYIGDMVAGDFVIAVELDLTVNSDGSLAPAMSYTNGLFSFGAGAKLDVQKEQSFTEQLFFSIAELRAQMEADRRASLKYGRAIDSLACPATVDTPLAGDLGIAETVHMAMNTPSLALNSKPGGPKSGAFGGYVKFVVVKNLNSVGPTWSLKYFKGPGPLAGFAETNTDQIIFAFAERAATGNLPPAPPAERKAMSLAVSKANASKIVSDIKATQVTTVLTQIQAAQH